MNKLQVRLSHVAERKLLYILERLEFEWSLKTRDKFLEEFTEKTEQIAVHPYSCQESEVTPGVFKAVINKHISAYYRVVKDVKIEIITVCDNNRDPNDILEEIKQML